MKNIISLSNKKVQNVQEARKLALEFGIDTAGESSRAVKEIEGIKAVPSDKIEAFRTILKQCSENPKSVIFDALSEIAE